LERTFKEKMRISTYILILLASALGFSSCNIAKHLPEGEKIYVGAAIKMVENDSTGAKAPLDLQENLDGVLRPQPNTTTFIKPYPYKVAFGYMIGEPKSEKGLRAWLSKKLGEKPVFINEKTIEKNADNLRDYLKTKGYFEASVKGELKTGKVSASADYTAVLNSRKRIDSVWFYEGETTFEQDFYKAAYKSDLGAYFDLETIKTVRSGIESKLRKNGYYFFKPDYVAIEADTLISEGGIYIRIFPATDMPYSAQKQYQINDIFVNIDSQTKIVSNDDPNSFDFFRGLILDDSKNSYKEEMFKDAIAFRPGTYYNSELQSITNNRLVGLANYKFVRSYFEVVNRLDSTLLDVYYNLQTQKPKSLRAELNAISRSSGLAGSQLSINWQNINTFKGAEFLKLSVNGNLELQVGGNTSSEYRDNYRLGFDGLLSFPRFLAPFIKIDPEESKVLPKTQIKLGYESFIKTGLYNLNSARGSLNYAWTRGRGIEHSLKPIGVNLVKSSNISTVFIDEIFNDPRLLIILENQFIAGGGYEISVNPKTHHKGYLSYRGAFDFAGNAFGLVDKIRNDPEKTGRIFGEYYAQYLRFENDLRYKRDVSQRVTWANRAIVGVGVPYGNSLQLPFVSQFYVGGNNSLRAFRARGVGPGTYARTGSLAEQFLGNNTGDIKLEANTEIRYKVSNFISTALFVDMGNVWMFKDEYIYGPGALFSKNFYKEMAVGTGLGLRFNFSFIIFRIDLATPVVKPWLDSGEKWVLKNVQPFNKTWRKENMVWNFAVGLPF
jgi:outer membrane protein assembly factor BamA